MIDTALLWVSVTNMSPKPKLRAATPWVVAPLSFSAFLLCVYFYRTLMCTLVTQLTRQFFCLVGFDWPIVCVLAGWYPTPDRSIGEDSDIELHLWHMPSSMHESDNFTLSRFPFPLVATSFLSGLTANAALVGSWSRFLRPLLQFGSFCPEPGCDRWW